MAGATDAVLEKYGDDLNGLVRRFESTGLGNKVKSWIGTGPNEGISTEEIKNAFGSELDQLAAKVGLGKDEAAADLSRSLPEAVNEATPNGTVPAGEATSSPVTTS
jgi:uncharacterized protein YidB (DUF937 family)